MKTKKTTPSSAAVNEADTLSYSEFLIRVRRATSASSNRVLTLRSLQHLVRAIRASLVVKDFNNEEITSGVYRVLRATSRTPISGPSCYLFFGGDAALYAKDVSALEEYAEQAVEELRSGVVTGDSPISASAFRILEELEAALSRSLYAFDVSNDALGSVQMQDITPEQIDRLVSKINDKFYDIPSVFIEAYLYAHAYIYNLSTLE